MGKIVNAASFLNNNSTETESQKSCVRVGKLDAAQIFKPETEKPNPGQVGQVKRVGKLNTDNIFPKNEPEEIPREKLNVGKLKIKVFHIHILIIIFLVFLSLCHKIKIF